MGLVHIAQSRLASPLTLQFSLYSILRHHVDNMKLFFVILFISVSLAQNGLQIQTLSGPTNCARKVQAGDKIEAHYSGTLESNGKKFDSSYDRGQPFQVQIGVGKVIKGWDQGIVGMCIGEKRKLIIPPELGYGQQGVGNGLIPGGATLDFEVELLGFEELE